MGNIFSDPEKKFQKEVEKFTAEVLGKSGKTEWCNQDDIKDMASMRSALQRSGVEACHLIVGIDFTGSNRWQGANSFHGQCLHKLGSEHGPNPYEQAIELLGEALSPFDGGKGDNVPAYVFGDAKTKNTSVRELPHRDAGIDSVLGAYREAAKNPSFSGPTTFAPLIKKAIEVVIRRNNTFHVLVILADGQVDDELDCLQKTREAIVEAANYPLSILMVGIGDGPWDAMNDFDDGLPERKFDNFQFVEFTKFQSMLDKATAPQKRVLQAAFAVCALQEVPAQFKAVRDLGMFNKQEVAGSGAKRDHPDGAEEPAAKRLRNLASSSAGASLEAPRWRCPKCTFLNPPSSASCDMCGEPREAVVITC